MGLNYSSKITHHVDYRDLEEYIKEVFGFDYEIAAAEECGNDTALHFNIDGEVDEYDAKDLEKLKSGEWVPYRTRMLLNVMAKNLTIPAGDYIVKVSW